MKKLLCAMLLVPFMASADVNEDLANICNIVKNDDKGELRKKMKTVKQGYGLTLKDYYSSISCGGNTLLIHSDKSNSYVVATLLTKKLPKSLVREEIKKVEESSKVYIIMKDRIE